MKEHFSRLYLSEEASIEDVKKAYRKLAKRFHPDQNNNSDEFINEFRLIQDSYKKLLEFLGDYPQKIDFKERNTKSTYKDNSKNNTTSNHEKNEKLEVVKTKTGKKVIYKLYSVEIHNIFICDKIINNSVIQYTNGLFLLIDMEIINNSNKTIILSEQSFKLQKEGGYEYSSSFKGLDGVVFRGYEAFDFKECHPQIPVTGFMAFEIPNIDDYKLAIKFPGFSINIKLFQDEFSKENFNELKNKDSRFNDRIDIPSPQSQSNEYSLTESIVYIMSILIIIYFLYQWLF